MLLIGKQAACLVALPVQGESPPLVYNVVWQIGVYCCHWTLMNAQENAVQALPLLFTKSKPMPCFCRYLLHNCCNSFERRYVFSGMQKESEQRLEVSIETLPYQSNCGICLGHVCRRSVEQFTPQGFSFHNDPRALCNQQFFKALRRLVRAWSSKKKEEKPAL
jgi:hypothetical protein